MSKSNKWLIRLLVGVGLVFLVRSIKEFSGPSYWRPQNTFDYVAVYLTTFVSLGFSGIFVLMFRIADLPASIWKRLWQGSMLFSIFGFAVSGVGNVIEDAFDIRDLGEFLYTLGFSGMFGLMASFVFILFLPEIRKRWGWFFAPFIAASVINFDYSGLMIGPGMVVLAWQERQRGVRERLVD